MTSWFGHTQTVASISKSVTTVAGGIICLESNVSNFMKKVIYYEGFFKRTQDKLPDVVNYAARKLIRRCYEYREAIREELQSSVAYVADAGRWLIGLEDWNTKMEKRLGQITELVILANSLLMEYALTGEIGAKGAEDDLSLYVHGIINSIVLQDDALFKDSLNKSKPNSATTSPRENPSPKAKASSFQTAVNTPALELELQSSLPEDDIQVNEDDDILNPFNNIREAYFAPSSDQRTQPMAIPAHVRAAVTSESSPHSSSTKSHSYSDYCHLDQEYADTLSEMTSFPTHKEWSNKAKKHSSPPTRTMESPVYDLTVSMDLQKEHANNPFLRDSFGDSTPVPTIHEEGSMGYHPPLLHTTK